MLFELSPKLKARRVLFLFRRTTCRLEPTREFIHSCVIHLIVGRVALLTKAGDSRVFLVSGNVVTPLSRSQSACFCNLASDEVHIDLATRRRWSLDCEGSGGGRGYGLGGPTYTPDMSHWSSRWLSRLRHLHGQSFHDPRYPP